MSDVVSVKRPPRVRPWMIVVGALVALGLLGGGIAFLATGGAAKAADDFFALNARQGPGAAWASAAPAFRAAMPAPGWEVLSRANGLEGYTGSNWSERSVSGDVAQLRGSLRLARGAAAAASVGLVKSASGWQVQTVSLGAGAMAAAPGASSERMAAAPGPAVVQACRTVLAQKAKLTLADAQCPPLPTTPGSTIQCPASAGGAQGVLKVTLGAVDANGQADLDCTFTGRRPSPAAG